MIETSHKYINWREYSGVKSNIECTWTSNEIEQLAWRETFMIDEIPANDVWDTFGTGPKLNLEQFLKSKGIPKETTKHYMSVRPSLSPGLSKILDNWSDRNHSYNFLKLTPGHNIVFHYDSYVTFIKFNNISKDNAEKINRTAVVLSDWSRGQVIQIGNSVYTHWQAGDTFTWTGDTWHGASNFGFEDLTVMQVTWL